MSNFLCFAAIIGLVSSIIVSIVLPKIMFAVSQDDMIIEPLEEIAGWFATVMTVEIFKASLMGVIHLKNETVRVLGLHAGFSILIMPMTLWIFVVDCEMGLGGVWLAKLITEMLETALFLVIAHKAEWGEGFKGSLFVSNTTFDLRGPAAEQADDDDVDGSAVYDESSIEMGTFRSEISKAID